MFNNTNYSYPWNNGGYPYTQNYNTSQPQQPSSGINWVQGEAGAKSYAIAPNQSVLLMDSENNVFYIKSSDASGMPMPLRIFDYTERLAVVKNEQINSTPKVEYITRQEFDKVITELKNAKQYIPTTKQQQQQQHS